ncbi:hypothetical protein DdX_18965 [Ditylenchus destructor]|uniref:Uncharacterized protein n=1 Tax=Ditylenchus destructor TaxID=166010 RepID=A0AAD4QXN5_9BILA|nr:hypothetical protein DdX_18965 [Ditylenchus destructor]
MLFTVTCNISANSAFFSTNFLHTTPRIILAGFHSTSYLNHPSWASLFCTQNSYCVELSSKQHQTATENQDMSHSNGWSAQGAAVIENTNKKLFYYESMETKLRVGIAVDPTASIVQGSVSLCMSLFNQ